MDAGKRLDVRLGDELPERKTSVTCYAYESWHYRFVGRDEATAIHDSGLTTREWIWANLGS